MATINPVLQDDGPTSEALLRDVESALQRQLPPALREHLAQHNGGSPERSVFPMPDGGSYELHEFLPVSAKANAGFLLAWDVGHVDPGFLPDHLIPFACDPGGAFFCMSDAASSYGWIFFVDPEFVDREENAVFLAPSLREFLEGMRA